MTQTRPKTYLPASSTDLAAAIAKEDFSASSATVVGYGNMGKQYVTALRRLGVGRLRVCSRSPEPLAELGDIKGVTIASGGYYDLHVTALPGEIGIVATPTADLATAAEHLAACGFRKILVEKPVSLLAREIQDLSDRLDSRGVVAYSGYNRVAYPSFLELRALASEEGGITSCTYDFTEIIGADWQERFTAGELARWGIANSMHVISMAHGLIGLPKTWTSYRSGAYTWHPTGAVFVGSGISCHDIPFSIHGDWGSRGRWSVEVHTQIASYRFCPLEKIFRKSSSWGDWEELTTSTFAPEVKAGITEQTAAMLSDQVGRLVPLVTIKDAATLTRYGEDIFGYRYL